MSPFKLILLLVVMVLIIAGIILVTQGQRRIPVQYAKRVVGRKIYGGQASHIPLSDQHRWCNPDHLSRSR